MFNTNTLYTIYSVAILSFALSNKSKNIVNLAFIVAFTIFCIEVLAFMITNTFYLFSYKLLLFNIIIFISSLITFDVFSKHYTNTYLGIIIIVSIGMSSIDISNDIIYSLNSFLSEIINGNINPKLMLPKKYSYYAFSFLLLIIYSLYLIKDYFGKREK